MQQKTVLTAEDVKKVMAAAETEAKNHHWAVSIVIVDDGGHQLALQRLDGAAPISATCPTFNFIAADVSPVPGALSRGRFHLLNPQPSMLNSQLSVPKTAFLRARSPP